MGLCLLAATLAGCGPSDDGTVAASVANQFTTATGLEVRIEPGTILDRQTDSPVVWAAHLRPALTAESGPDDPDPTTLTLANLSPAATATRATVERFEADGQETCADDPSETIDCADSDDPVCDGAQLQFDPEVATRAELTVDLPPCTRFSIELGADRSAQTSLRIAVAGRTDTPAPLADITRRAAERDAAFLVLAGDNAEDSTTEDLRALSDRLRRRPLPVVLLPGELEAAGPSLNTFQTLLGPPDLSWETQLSSGLLQFVDIATANQTLGSDGIDEVVDRLNDFDEDSPLVTLTHTPPLDPKSLRDRGFRSRIEGARLLSAMADEGVDLLLAGHLATTHDTTLEDLPTYVAGESTDGEFALLELTPTDGQLAVEVTRVD
jgi:hypothetical protein